MLVGRRRLCYTRGVGRRPVYTALLEAIFRLAEFLINFELNNRAKRLIVHYLNESREADLGGRAREAVRRYTQMEFPSVSRIKEKNREEELNVLDHLILQMEYEAKQLTAANPVIHHFELPG